MTKVLFVSHGAALVGAERSLLTLIDAALARGCVVAVSIPADGPLVAELERRGPDITISLEPSRRWMGARTFSRNAAKTALGLLDARRFIKRMHQFVPDVVVVNSTVVPAPMIAARLGRIPLVVMIRESVLTNPTLTSALPRRLLVRCIRRWASCTIAVSEFVAEQFGGVDDVIAPRVGPRLPTLDRPPVRTGPLIATMLGTFSSEKGQLDAVRAIAELRRAQIEVQLRFYGSISEAEATMLRKTIAIEGVEDLVTHQGETGEVIAVLRQGDFSLVCSRNEAYGRVTAESLLAGIPVVGYNVGGTAEILRDGGGILCEPTPAALAGAVGRLARDRSLLERVAQDAWSVGARISSSKNAERAIDVILGAARNPEAL